MIKSSLSPLSVVERRHLTKAELKRIVGDKGKIAIVTDLSLIHI